MGPEKQKRIGVVELLRLISVLFPGKDVKIRFGATPILIITEPKFANSLFGNLSRTIKKIFKDWT